MTHDERVARLKNMLSQVARPSGLEELAVPQPLGELEAMSEESDLLRDKAATALEKLRAGAPISPEEAAGLEAIVLPDKRPVVFIHNNVFDPVPMDDWAHLNTPEMHARLEPLFPSIGRIELPTTPNIPYGGTGFVVGPNLLMTKSPRRSSLRGRAG